ncbi:MAG TPA: hypothetical protein V6D23_28015 [Candidatus Obscuribacterales bacterium]
MDSAIKIYTRDSLHQLAWPATPDGDYARRFLTPLIKDGTLAYFDNIDAEIQVLEADGQIFPLVLGNLAPRVKNSYVASPMSHYIDYGREEMDIELHDYPWLKAPLKPLVGFLEQAFRATGLEKVVLVNNWLLSTNLYPGFATDRLEAITRKLVAAFPDRVIVFRSVNTLLNQTIYDQLLGLDYAPVFSRQVYILDPAKKLYQSKDSYKRDLRIARRTDYVWESRKQLTPREIAHLRILYDDLYLHKYSTLNPQFNTRFIEAALELDWLEMAWLRKPGRELPDAVIGWFARDGVMTAPLVGYDRSQPEKAGLFRLATLKLLQEAVSHNWILHQSSGVSKYKLHRGAEAAMEYNMVYYRHCSARRQWPWRTLKLLTDKLLEPMMKQLGL